VGDDNSRSEFAFSGFLFIFCAGAAAFRLGECWLRHLSCQLGLELHGTAVVTDVHKRQDGMQEPSGSLYMPTSTICVVGLRPAVQGLYTNGAADAGCTCNGIEMYWNVCTRLSYVPVNHTTHTAIPACTAWLAS
jgi:hypothetical protein